MANSLFDRILDASILFSFDRTGYLRHARDFEPDALDVDLHGKTALVTGANAGLGRVIALELAKRGAAVVMVCRSPDKGLEAAETIRKISGNAQVRLEIADLSDLDSVAALAGRLPETKVDILVHNAGLLPDEKEVTPQGLELTFATHVVGPFLLTRLLEDRLTAARLARVIFVSSGGMYSQRLSLRDIDWSERPYDGVSAYAQTKRMQVVLSEMLASRLREKGIRVNAMHPGWAATDGVKTSLPRFWRVMRPLLRSPEEGADTAIWLAASKEATNETGRFWLDRAPRSTYLLPNTVETAARRQELFERCEELIAGYAASPDA